MILAAALRIPAGDLQDGDCHHLANPTRAAWRGDRSRRSLTDTQHLREASVPPTRAGVGACERCAFWWRALSTPESDGVVARLNVWDGEPESDYPSCVLLQPTERNPEWIAWPAGGSLMPCRLGTRH